MMSFDQAILISAVFNNVKGAMTQKNSVPGSMIMFCNFRNTFFCAKEQGRSSRVLTARAEIDSLKTSDRHCIRATGSSYFPGPIETKD